MKKILITCLFVQMTAVSAFAQYQDAVLQSSDTIRTSIVNEVATIQQCEAVPSVIRERDKHNWFIEVGVGGGFYAGEANRLVNNPLTRLRPSIQLGIGKWIASSWALRVAGGFTKFEGTYMPFTYWNMFDKGDHATAPAEALADYYTDEFGRRWFKRKINVIDGEFDIIYDLNRLFTTRKTPFDILTYAGLGYSVALKGQGVAWHGSIDFKLGIDVRYHLSDKFYLKAGVEGTICDESLDGCIGGFDGKTNRTVEGYAKALVGFGFNFGSKKKTMLMTSVPYTVNVDREYTLRPKIVTDDFRAPFVVRFYIDQYNVEPDQELNIAKVCKYLEEHPSARLQMTGHADPETATPEYNQKLSERRCQSVLDYINKNYKIDNSRIDVKPMGDKDSKFKEDFRWNRCVILTIIDK